MATLYDRLFVPSNDYGKIPCHIFYAALVDMATGNSSKEQLVTAFSLDASSEAQFDTLITAYQNSTNKNQWLQELHAVMMLAEWELKYNSPSAFATRMGL